MGGFLGIVLVLLLVLENSDDYEDEDENDGAADFVPVTSRREYAKAVKTERSIHIEHNHDHEIDQVCFL